MRWPLAALLALTTQVRQFNAATGVVVRLLLLTRSAGYWSQALADRIEADLGVAADEIALPPLHMDSEQVFREAAD